MTQNGLDNHAFQWHLQFHVGQCRLSLTNLWELWHSLRLLQYGLLHPKRKEKCVLFRNSTFTRWYNSVWYNLYYLPLHIWFVRFSLSMKSKCDAKYINSLNMRLLLLTGSRKTVIEFLKIITELGYPAPIPRKYVLFFLVIMINGDALFLCSGL